MSLCTLLCKPLICLRAITLVVMLAFVLPNAVPVYAQPAGQLYDPEPPADSAYVRVIVVSHEGLLDLLVDGKPRGNKLSAGQVSDYFVLKSGKHSITFQSSAKPSSAPNHTTNHTITHTIEAVGGRATTIAFTTIKAGTVPTTFDDKANTNKLKSLVAAYHLDPNGGALSLVTADGKTEVFKNMAFGTSSSIQVNPIKVELVAAKTGAAIKPAAPADATNHASLTMNAGATYSVFMLPNSKNNLIARAVQNKTEPYSSK